MKLVFLTILTVSFLSNCLGQNLIPKKEAEKWGFVDEKGNWIITPQFNEVRKFSEGKAAVLKGNKWGFIDQKGEFIIKPEFGQVMDFSEDMAAVMSLKPLQGTNVSDHLQHKWGFVDGSGKLVIPFTYRNIFYFQNGIARVALWGMKDKELFFIDKNGTMVSPPFERIWTYADKYKLANSRDDGDSVYCFTELDGTPLTDWYLNNFTFKDFPVVVELPVNQLNIGRPTDAFSGKSAQRLKAWLDEKGSIVSEWYDEILAQKNELTPVKRLHKWTFLTSDFVEIYPPRYESITSLENGCFSAQLGLSSGVLLGENGEELARGGSFFEIYESKNYLSKNIQFVGSLEIPYVALFDSQGKQLSGWYQSIERSFLGLARVEEWRIAAPNELNMYYNYIETETGELLSEWRLANALSWDKNECTLERDKVLNLLFAKSASFKIDPDFFMTLFKKDLEINNEKILFKGDHFREGMALVSSPTNTIDVIVDGHDFKIEDVKYGYIDWNGKEVIPCRFTQASGFRDGKAIVGDGKKFGAIDKSGNLIIPYQYDLMGCFGDGLAPVLLNGKWGFVSSDNKLIIPAQYDDVRCFSLGLAPVQKDGLWGLIDAKGHLVLPFEYKIAPEFINQNQVKVLKKGFGYKVLDVASIKSEAGSF